MSPSRRHRTQNHLRVLDALLSEREGLTHRALVERLELGDGAVRGVLHDLDPVLREAAGWTAAGRRVTRWSLDPSAGLSMGVDIGRRHIAVACVDLSGRPAGHIRPVRADVADTLASREETLRIAARLIKRSIGTRERCRSLVAVTVSLPGPVVGLDGGGGAKGLYMAGEQQWHLHDVREELRAMWPLPEPPTIRVENDANVAALAEARGRPNSRALAYLKWSSGVGCGLVLDGLWRGASGTAGELGHIRVRIDDSEALSLGLGQHWDQCERCSSIDCVHWRAGGAAVARACGAPDVAAALAMVRSGDARAREALGAAARLVGRAVGPMLSLLDLDTVVIGGQIGRTAFDLVEDQLVEEALCGAFPMHGRLRFVAPGSRGREAAAYGAAYSALRPGEGARDLLRLAG